ncbi:CocE/NonD family hydrolase [uncultured Cyclobacterium sp.]|uniref:CocE/NonD family hydrolase n=1 Tax=uncultured Cyclobacterium sp. TaxID=453820 RepID=UPI0030ED5CE7
MINLRAILVLFALFLFDLHSAFAQEISQVETLYEKTEHDIPMRDGVNLHTVVYSPRDKSKTYPILMQRTPYSAGPYGSGKMKDKLGPSHFLMEDGYIFVYQDVRGRWMSEGQYDNMRPTLSKRVTNSTEIDESTDTFDTIEWLLANVSNHNEKVGIWGISYPGFYSAAALPYSHPNLKAVSPQAPIGDFYFDDFHHNGAYLLSYWLATTVFGYQKDGPTEEAWYDMVNPETSDGYQFFMDMGPLKNADKWYGEDNFFWQQLKDNPNYNSFWQKRSIIPHLKEVKPAVLTVGGWFDAEDLYGSLTIYKTIESNNPNTYNAIVIGPWSHGDWSRETGPQIISNIYFGDSISTWYQKNIEQEFFNHFLKKAGEGKPALPEAYMFDTGKHQWEKFNEWPPKNSQWKSFYLHDKGKLSVKTPEGDRFSTFISDPANPVPYSQDIKLNFTPRKYMADDQRFAARRPDVLTFETEVLQEDMTLAGEIMARLKVATSQTDADWIVKLIDIYPGDYPNHEFVLDGVEMGNYHLMVRSEVLRGRYRESFEFPKQFVPDQISAVDFRLQDVFHTFKQGHKIQIQIQSTWFPLIDRNPQKYVENIFEAESEDFIKATHRVFHTEKFASKIEVMVLP